jgi:hypothetical protein
MITVAQKSEVSVHSTLHTSSNLTMMLFWVVTPRRLVGTWRQYVSPKPESTRRHNPEKQHRHPHRRENLKTS